MPRWIEYLPVVDLVPDPVNPKDHAIDDLRQSMQRFGYTEPIVLDERTGMLLSGHGRAEVLVADQLEQRELPEGVIVDDDGRWLAPVVRGVRSENDVEAHAYLIAANRLTERGGWRADPLVALLAEVQGSERGLDGVGYSSDEVSDLLASLGPVPTLDELSDRHGEPAPEDFWPTLRFKVSPELKARWEALAGEAGGNDTAQFALVVELAERGSKRNS